MIRVDGWRMLYMTRYITPPSPCMTMIHVFTYVCLYGCRRIQPVGAQDIGSWLEILQLTATLAVMTNAGLLCFTMEIITLSNVYRIWIFIIFQYFVFSGMKFLDIITDDVPEEVNIQVGRGAYLSSRIELTDDDRKEEEAKRLHVVRPSVAPQTVTYEVN